MRARYRPLGVIVAASGVAACSLSGLTFDLGAGGAGGGTAAATATGTVAATSTGATGGASSSIAATSTGTGVGIACGDGVVQPGEPCDDGNLVPLDGCSPACTIDVPETCPGALIPLTPAGFTVTGTLVGATQDLKPTCGAGKADLIYAVVPSVSGTLAASLPGGGQGGGKGVLAIRSTCADGLASELTCKQNSGAVAQIWVEAGVTYWVVVAGDPAPFTLDLKLFPCGNGTVEGLEQCDDPADAKCIGCLKCNGASEVRDPISQHCYQLATFGFGAKSWPSARAACVAWGGDLAAISSQEELSFLDGKSQLTSVWLGGSDAALECSYTWSNGEPWFAKWDPSQPDNSNGNEDCVAFTPNGTINDLGCGNALDYICERAPAGSCGDGIVQPGEECDDAIPSTWFTCTACKIACNAGEFEDPATRHCYRVVPALVTSAQAVNACVALGAHLAAINTPAENALIQAHTTAPSWIGLGQGAAWINTDPFCFTNNLGSGGPGKGCSTILPDGTWSAIPCASTRGYVCEREN
ncbi:MAG: lectin-like protein [Byssovorax sp.]